MRVSTHSAGLEAGEERVLTMHVQQHLRYIGGRVIRVGDYVRRAGSVSKEFQAAWSDGKSFRRNSLAASR